MQLLFFLRVAREFRLPRFERQSALIRPQNEFSEGSQWCVNEGRTVFFRIADPDLVELEKLFSLPDRRFETEDGEGEA